MPFFVSCFADSKLVGNSAILQKLMMIAWVLLAPSINYRTRHMVFLRQATHPSAVKLICWFYNTAVRILLPFLCSRGGGGGGGAFDFNNICWIYIIKTIHNARIRMERVTCQKLDSHNHHFQFRDRFIEPVITIQCVNLFCWSLYQSTSFLHVVYNSIFRFDGEHPHGLL